jgi:hypothetical protein
LAEGETNQRSREYKIIKPELEGEIQITKSCLDWVEQRSGKRTARRKIESSKHIGITWGRKGRVRENINR